MTEAQPNLFTRHDTFFGVCEGLGEDLGFNADYLRVVLGVSVMFSPVIVLSIYAGLGVVVFATRKLFPARQRSAAELATAPAVANDESIVVVAQAA